MKKILTTCLLFSFIAHAQAEIKVVATIKPLQSLAQGLLDGISEVPLIVKQGSVHGYQLRPSDVRAVHQADMVLYVSDYLETFIPALKEKNPQKTFVEWAKINNVTLLPPRKGGLWQAHEHSDHQHDHAHDHDHSEQDHEHEEDDHHHHAIGDYDPHLWMSVKNAQALVTDLAQQFVKIAPEHQSRIQENAQKLKQELHTLASTQKAQLAPYHNRPFLVFHDAYAYFEQANDLNALGVVRIDVEHEPGAKRIANIHRTLQSQKIYCIFKEVQFNASLIDKLAAGSNVKIGTLDPLGSALPEGKGMYIAFMRQLGDSFAQCLKD